MAALLPGEAGIISVPRHRAAGLFGGDYQWVGSLRSMTKRFPWLET